MQMGEEALHFKGRLTGKSETILSLLPLLSQGILYPKNGTLYGIAPEDSASCWVQKKGHTLRPFAP